MPIDVVPSRFTRGQFCSVESRPFTVPEAAKGRAEEEATRPAALAEPMAAYRGLQTCIRKVYQKAPTAAAVEGAFATRLSQLFEGIANPSSSAALADGAGMGGGGEDEEILAAASDVQGMLEKIFFSSTGALPSAASTTWSPFLSPRSNAARERGRNGAAGGGVEPSWSVQQVEKLAAGGSSGLCTLLAQALPQELGARVRGPGHLHPQAGGGLCGNCGMDPRNHRAHLMLR